MVFDIILITIIIICAYLGYKRGFVRTLCNLGAFALSVIASFVLYGYVSDFIASSFVGEFINEKLSESMSAVDINLIPEFLQSNLSVTTAGLGSTVAVSLTGIVVNVVSIILTFILARLVIKIIFKVFDIFAKLPIIKQCNRLLGIIFGISSGCFWAYVTVFVAMYISVIPQVSFLQSVIESSELAGIVREFNFLPNILPM